MHRAGKAVTVPHTPLTPRRGTELLRQMYMQSILAAKATSPRAPYAETALIAHAWSSNDYRSRKMLRPETPDFALREGVAPER
ncbi:MAG: hypothetical protein ABS58_00785 [Mesorhizobium sp. SCN 65-20]|nr:MAG: hypothetical protein ABS58_00785 [Mesorhizobium sp. SCN 65-20]